MVNRSQWWPVVVTVGTAAAVGIAAHTAVNLRLLRRPTPRPEIGSGAWPAPSPGDDSESKSESESESESVSILIPARDEAATIRESALSALEQDGITDLEVLVLDDGSTDGTGALIDELAGHSTRLRAIHGEDQPPPPGWLGKPWACQRLADAASGSVLVFMDADVTIERDAVAALTDEMRAAGLAMIAPYPAQRADGWLERLVQPLVTWSWVATMPLSWAERSLRPSLSAANGQLLVVDSAAYHAAGGHAAVRDEVLEDIGMMRAFKRAGFHAATVDGSHLAACRMYATTGEVIDGYGKSLWAAFNGPAGSVAVNSLLFTSFVVPAAGMLTPGRRVRVVGAIGYAAGVVSRALVAQRTGERILPDVLAHPMSIAAFTGLNVLSWKRHLRGENRWKGRTVTVGGNR